MEYIKENPKIYEIPRFLPGGIAVYPKKGDLPPPDMVGYRRRGNNPKSIDSWIFIPLWEDCFYRQRQLMQHDGGCKCVRIVMVCMHPENKDTRLTLEGCKFCQLKFHEHESFVEVGGGKSISEGIVVADEGNSEMITESPQTEACEDSSLPSEDSAVINSDSQ